MHLADLDHKILAWLHNLPNGSHAGIDALCVNINAQQMEEWFRRDVGRLEASKELLRRWIESEPAAKDLTAIRREIASLERSTSPEVIEVKRNCVWDLAMSSPVASADLDRQLVRILEKCKRNCNV